MTTPKCIDCPLPATTTYCGEPVCQSCYDMIVEGERSEAEFRAEMAELQFERDDSEIPY